MKHQVDVLLEEWNKSADVLFSIHPIDGSLLVWHVDWLDEYQPEMFRQAQVCVKFDMLYVHTKHLNYNIKKCNSLPLTFFLNTDNY